MNDYNYIYDLIVKFRYALDEANRLGKLDFDKTFVNFPKQCCGETCYLLGEYLRTNGINTIYVSASLKNDSHAWLVLKDNRVKTHKNYVNDKNIIGLYSKYSSIQYEDTLYFEIYREEDINNGLIIDITGDQFDEEPVYFGYIDNFHIKFDFIQAFDLEPLSDSQLLEIYHILLKYLP